MLVKQYLHETRFVGGVDAFRLINASLAKISLLSSHCCEPRNKSRRRRHRCTEAPVMKIGNIYLPSAGNLVCGQRTEDAGEMKSVFWTGGGK